MYCKECGILMLANALFCNNCGAKVEQAQTQVPAGHIQNSYETPYSGTMVGIHVKGAKPANYALAVFFGFLMFVFCVLFLMVLNARLALRPEAIERMTAQIDIPNIRVGRMMNLEGRAYDRDITLSEWIYDQIHPSVIRRHNITLRSVENLLDALPIDEFAATTLTRYSYSLLAGNINVRIPNRDIENFIRSNEWIFSRELGITFTERDYDLINNGLNDIDLHRLSHLGTILDDAGINYSLIRWGLSSIVLAALLLMAASMMVCIFFTCGFRLYKTCVSSGIVLICSGVVIGLLGILLNTIVASFVPASIDGALINAILRGIQNTIMLTGLVALVAGIAPIAIVFGVTRKVSKRIILSNNFI